MWVIIPKCCPLDLIRDLRMTNVQKAGMAVALTTDSLAQANTMYSREKGQWFIRPRDLALLGHVSIGLSHRRRELLKPALRLEYAAFSLVCG